MTAQVEIPLNKLKLSPTNVRTDPGDVRTLARSIQSIGLINPLAVTKNGRGWLVEAGGRRLAALQLLRDNGHFAKDEPIPCRVFDSPSVARSLAENHERAPMDAVQQFQAFDRLIGEGHTVHEVAETFSVTVQFVRQRVKLAELAPEVIAAYRQGRVNLEQMAALTFGTHSQQIAIVAEPRVPGAYELRERLRGKVIRQDDPRMKLVGIKAYHKAGGRTITDLFASTEDAVDEDVLDQLVRERLLKEAAEAQADGAAFAEVVEYGQQFFSPKYVAPPADFKPTDEQQAELDRLTREITEAQEAIDAAEEALDQASGDEKDALHVEFRDMTAAFRRLNGKHDKLFNACMIPKTDIPVGTLIALDYQGTIRTRQVCRAADVKHLATTPAPGSTGATGNTTPPEPPGREDLTAKGAQDIAQHRQAGLALVLSGWPQFTLALVVQAWDFAIFGGVSGREHGSAPEWQRPTPWLGDLRECPTPRPAALTEQLRAITITPANDRRRPYRADRPQGHIPISWYIDQPKRVLLDILAHCVAHALCDPDSSDGKGHNSIPATARETITALVTAADFDLANYWQPTPEWLKGYGKAKTISALEAAGVTGDELDAFKAQKAGELYTAAAPVLAEKRWVPTFGISS